jgi:nucleotide-binding universal stress UspA family protein
MSHPSAPEQQVVVAYDFSGSGITVLERALNLVCRAPFHTLHVVAVIDPRLGIPAIPAATDVDYRYADQVQHELMRIIAAGFAAHGGPSDVHYFAHARIGKPATEILRLAQEIGADLIIVGSHNHLGVRRWLLGSTSERVVREAACPVIVAREKTYQPVTRQDVVEIEPHRGHYVPPHRYHYEDRTRELTRPNDWPF